MVNTREMILKTVAEVVEEETPVGFPGEITDDTELIELSLDSIVFAALVSRLEENLGYIPTNWQEGAFYPTTVGDLVAVYEDSEQAPASRQGVGGRS